MHFHFHLGLKGFIDELIERIKRILCVIFDVAAPVIAQSQEREVLLVLFVLTVESMRHVSRSAGNIVGRADAAMMRVKRGFVLPVDRETLGTLPIPGKIEIVWKL